MANNDSSLLKAKNKKIPARRRSARIADIVASSEKVSQPKPSTSRDKSIQSKQRSSTTDIANKRKRDTSTARSTSSTEVAKKPKAKLVPPKKESKPISKNSSTEPKIKKFKKSKIPEPEMDTSNNDAGDSSNNQNNNANNQTNTPSPMGYFDADERDIGRLHALLENRGLPSQLFNALHSFGPRVHQLLQRQMGSGMLHQVQLLNDGLLSNDETQQMTAAVEMSQMLVMGNEESLSAFPIKQIVPSLIVILRNHHNFALVNHVCRALTYMMESLPRSSMVIVQATPVFLEKLQVIQCIDVAEQSLSALEKLSKRHAPYLLKVGAVSTCLQFIDFFSIPSQRTALTITLNCCAVVSDAHATMIKDSLNLLIDRLNQQDQRSLEIVCQSIISLVENLKTDVQFMKCLLKHSLIRKLQPLLILTPQMISSQTFMQLIHMLVTMCSVCPDVAIELLNNDIAGTLFTLLVSNSYEDGRMDLARRSPQETYQLISLISELMPTLPKDGLFSIDMVIIEDEDSSITDITKKTAIAQWQWKDNAGHWLNYSPTQCKAIELAFRLGEYEILLTSESSGRQLSIVLSLMSQLDEQTGEANPIRRHLQPILPAVKMVPINLSNDVDCRIIFFKTNTEITSKFIKKLFIVLYQVYNSSAGPSVRQRCLQALLRMIYDAPSTLLTSVISCPMISNCIASMLTSDDIRAIVSGLQMATILMQKLPELFATNFRREGVLHQIEHLSKDDYFKEDTSHVIVIPDCEPKQKEVVKLGKNDKKRKNSKKAVPSSSIPSTSSSASTSASATTACGTLGGVASGSSSLTNESLPSIDVPSTSSGRILRNNNNKKKNEPSTSNKVGISNQTNKRTTQTPQQIARPTTHSRRPGNARGLLGNLFNSRWRNSNSQESYDHSNILNGINVDELRVHKELTQSASQSSKAYAKNRNNIKMWICKQAKELIKTYFTENINKLITTLSINDKLKSLPDSFKKFNGGSISDMKTVLESTSDLIMKSDPTAFELIQCGMVDAMIAFFNSDHDDIISKDDRLHMFCDIFCNKKIDENGIMKLVERLIDCLHHSEQFPVKVLDLPEGGTSCMKFINNNQVKCLLCKHPDCSQLKAWRGGPVKIDPLAVMSSIERYLILRGYTTNSDDQYSDDETEDEDDDDDMDERELMAASALPSNHRIEFLMNNIPLPYGMTIYEAVRLYSPALARNTNKDCLSTCQIWAHSHILQYRFKALEKVSSETTLVKSKSLIKSSLISKQTLPVFCSNSNDVIRNIINESIDNNVTFDDPSVSILTLLKIINNLLMHGNKYIENSKELRKMCESVFVSSKLDVKVSRQVKDPLVVLTADLPTWIAEICKICPFLIPFATREMVFASTSFDKIRLLVRLQGNTRDQNTQNANSSANGSHSSSSSRMMPRLERKKRVVERNRILQQAETIFKDLSGDKSLLELQYSNEVGTGLGPTLEFYSLVSKELQREDLDLWRGDSIIANRNTSDNDEPSKVSYIFNETGLFFKPIPIFSRHKCISAKKRNLMIMLGQMMAKSLHDSRMIDIPLSIPFYKWLLGVENTMNIEDLEQVDSGLASTWRKLRNLVDKKISIEKLFGLVAGKKNELISNLQLDGCSVESLSLDFTLPGYPNIDLIKNGAKTTVDIYNLEGYLNLVLQFTLVNCVRVQFEFVKKGFKQVFPLEKLKFFYPQEMDQLLCGSNYQQWTVEELMRSTKCDHGYTMDSSTICNLFSVLSSYDYAEQREFLQFTTGSPRLPIGGLSSLSPNLTIVKKIVDAPASPNDYLPSVMTCANYLKLPAYTDADVLRMQLKKASTEGQSSFHLS